jgi:hypothetical protein
MSIDERRKYLHKMQNRYWQATRKGRSRLLDEIEHVTGLHRKSLIRLLRGDLRRKPRTRQRGSTYTQATQEAIRQCAEALDYPCAERLQPLLLFTAQHLARHGQLTLSSQVAQQLQQVSVSSVRRIVGPVRHEPARLSASRRSPRRRSAVARAVPTTVIPAHTATPGHLEGDTVHHNGSFGGGLYAFSLGWTDVASGWVATRATLGNSALVMEDAFQALLIYLPFPIHEMHTDNGPEFLNDLIQGFLLPRAITFTRSRPYRKNDNRFVEENNGSHIRAYVGYGRLDSVAQVHALNAFYPLLDLYHNLFQPSMRRQKDGRYTVTTPLDRLLASDVWEEATAQTWQAYRASLDLLALRHAIMDALNSLEQAPPAQDGQREDVRQTLGLWKQGTTLRFATGCPPFPTVPTTITTATAASAVPISR